MEPESTQAGRLALARQAVRDLLDLLENEAVPVERPLMKAQRLARLMRDEDAQRWLGLELSGYPDEFSATQLGTCAKYCSRVYEDGEVYTWSLPKIEADAKAAGELLNRFQTPSIGGAANVGEARASAMLVQNVVGQLGKMAERLALASSSLSALRAMVHRYASDVSLALELGDVAEEIFDEARVSVDRFVQTCCPQAAQQLVAVNERLREGSTESRSAALTACRRLFASVADAVFPPRNELIKDGAGRQRKVGPDEHKNRILAFVEERVRSDSSVAILGASIEHIASRLDVVYEKACKGVHVIVDPQEARLTVIETYLLLAEVARLWASDASRRPVNAKAGANPGA